METVGNVDPTQGLLAGQKTGRTLSPTNSKIYSIATKGLKEAKPIPPPPHYPEQAKKKPPTPPPPLDLETLNASYVEYKTRHSPLSTPTPPPPEEESPSPQMIQQRRYEIPTPHSPQEQKTYQESLKLFIDTEYVFQQRLSKIRQTIQDVYSELSPSSEEEMALLTEIREDIEAIKKASCECIAEIQAAKSDPLQLKEIIFSPKAAEYFSSFERFLTKAEAYGQTLAELTESGATLLSLLNAKKKTTSGEQADFLAEWKTIGQKIASYSTIFRKLEIVLTEEERYQESAFMGEAAQRIESRLETLHENVPTRTLSPLHDLKSSQLNTIEREIAKKREKLSLLERQASQSTLDINQNKIVKAALQSQIQSLQKQKMAILSFSECLTNEASFNQQLTMILERIAFACANPSLTQNERKILFDIQEHVLSLKRSSDSCKQDMEQLDGSPQKLKALHKSQQGYEYFQKLLAFSKVYSQFERATVGTGTSLHVALTKEGESTWADLLGAPMQRIMRFQMPIKNACEWLEKSDQTDELYITLKKTHDWIERTVKELQEKAL